ncbi:MAG: hypothetical protein AB7H43_15285 [Acidimicrobiia bacterium]
MSDAAEARAEAAAAKARAKAMRPWYRKKRWWAVGIIAVLIGISAASSGGDDNPVAATDDGGVQSSSSNEKNPPVDDVTITGCEKSSIGASVDYQIVNHSSRRSNYAISVTIESGTTKVGEAHGFVNDVEPGQTAVDGTFGTVSGSPASITCRLVEVERYAS